MTDAMNYQQRLTEARKSLYENDSSAPIVGLCQDLILAIEGKRWTPDGIVPIADLTSEGEAFRREALKLIDQIMPRHECVPTAPTRLVFDDQLIELVRRAVATVTPLTAAAEWKWPVNTVGNMINSLSSLPPDMPLNTAYFVRIDGKNVARTTAPSCSRERVNIKRQRIEEGNADIPYSLIIWASQDERAANAEEVATVVAALEKQAADLDMAPDYIHECAEDAKVIRTAITLLQRRAVPEGYEFPYQRTFNAIKAAVSIERHPTVAISVQAFQDTFNAASSERAGNES